jgi:hypothetical protein
MSMSTPWITSTGPKALRTFSIVTDAMRRASPASGSVARSLPGTIVQCYPAGQSN